MTVLVAVLLGVLIGLSLGALGGGGSILTVPALVYALGEPARAATTGSLVIVGMTALAGAAGHARSGNVRWGTGLLFGAVGVATSFAGTALNAAVDPDVLLLAFGGLMLVAAAALGTRTSHPVPALLEDGVGGAEDARAGRPAGVPLAPGPGGPGHDGVLTRQTAAKVVVAGLVVGFLTGFLGVGGGFLIVPALVMVLAFPMSLAVGTSLVIIAINSAASLVARAGAGTFHWSVIVPFTLAAIVGSLAGKRVADRVDGPSLTRAFAGLMVAVAVYVIARSVLALA